MSLKFSYEPFARFASSKTNIKRPREIAYFSYDADHKLLPFSDASLRYYYPPLFGAPGEGDEGHPVDLTQGFESFRKHDDTQDEHLDALLATLQALEEQTHQKVQAHVVTWRGMMTKLLTAPYEGRDGFEMNATLHDGTIFVEENHAFKRQSEKWPRGNPPVHMLRAQYMGYKFEALSTLKRRHVEATREEIEKRSTMQVSNEEQYCSIVQTGIGDTSLILAGEVDAVLGEKPDNAEEPIPWVELKTTRNVASQKDEEVYSDKWLKFWAQSFLLGVPHVVIGFRTVQGRLLSIEQIPTHRFPTMAKQRAARYNTRSWDGNVCINFAAGLLDFLREHITTPDVVWRISHSPRSGHVTMTVDKSIDALSIVTASFREHRATLKD